MTGKHYNWHRHWRWGEGGRLLHGSGLALEWDKELGWVATEDTCEAWATFEHAAAKGAGLADMPATRHMTRGRALPLEFAVFHENSPLYG